MSDRALVVLSGGQDSTTCLYWAIDKFGQDAVSTITFDYGQRHRIEIECASKVAELAGVANTLLPIDTFTALGGNALTDDIEVNDDVADPSADTLPKTFVPGRNLIFLTYAAAYAWQHDIQHLVTGVAQTDYSGYPDCRPEFIEAFETLANRATKLGIEDRSFRVHAPLLRWTKARIVQEADRLGVDTGRTLSCYDPGPAGEPCGQCDSCVLRARGFSDAGLVDPAGRYSTERRIRVASSRISSATFWASSCVATRRVCSARRSRVSTSCQMRSRRALVIWLKAV